MCDGLHNITGQHNDPMPRGLRALLMSCSQYWESCFFEPCFPTLLWLKPKQSRLRIPDWALPDVPGNPSVPWKARGVPSRAWKSSPMEAASCACALLCRPWPWWPVSSVWGEGPPTVHRRSWVLQGTTRSIPLSPSCAQSLSFTVRTGRAHLNMNDLGNDHWKFHFLPKMRQHYRYSRDTENRYDQWIILDYFPTLHSFMQCEKKILNFYLEHSIFVCNFYVLEILLDWSRICFHNWLYSKSSTDSMEMKVNKNKTLSEKEKKEHLHWTYC